MIACWWYERERVVISEIGIPELVVNMTVCPPCRRRPFGPSRFEKTRLAVLLSKPLKTSSRRMSLERE